MGGKSVDRPRGDGGGDFDGDIGISQPIRKQVENLLFDRPFDEGFKLIMRLGAAGMQPAEKFTDREN